MKQLIKSTHFTFGLFAMLLLCLSSAHAQNLAGSWRGELDVQAQKIPLVFHFQQADGQWQGSMDSPAQGALGIPITEVSLTDSGLTLSIAGAGIRYEGAFAGADDIQGTFLQGGMQFALNLNRGDQETDTDAPLRPQEPTPPFPYLTEDIVFTNTQAGVRLAGTLTLPFGEGPWPAVVLLAGSGPNDRDQHIFGHKTLLVIADHLTRHGVATLRYDKRGVADSQGDYALATSRDFANDAQTAWNYLRQHKDVDDTRVGLLGHSEGGMIAPMVAGKHSEVAFVALLAAPGIPIDSLMAKQTYLLGKVSGMDEGQLAYASRANREIYRMLKEIADDDSLHTSLEQSLQQHALANNIPAEQAESLVANQLQQLMSPWYRSFIQYDPEPSLSAITVPVLAINGDQDLQVTARENLEGIKKALENAGNPEVTIRIFPGLNHLFQESQTGAVSEYATIEQTISPEVLQLLSDWIMEQTVR